MLRQREPEIMDGPLDPAAHEHALRSLNRIDRLLRVHQRLARYLRELGDPAQMSVVDLGSGGGGFLGHLARLPAGERAYKRVLAGVDRSHFALTRARAWQGPTVRGIVADARRVPLADASVDVVTCSLFLHHFDGPEVVAILREAARVARRGVVLSDLSRSRTALGLTWLTTRLVSRSPVFHEDGIRSVRAAYRAGELEDLAHEAGLAGARVKAIFPFRLLLAWRKVGGYGGDSTS